MDSRVHIHFLIFIFCTGARGGPKPGNYLLPSFGFCSLQEASQDIKFIITNKHKLVCELSQHILYQYVFIMFWFCMIFGIIISSGGFLWTVTNYIITIMSLVSHRKGRYLIGWFLTRHSTVWSRKFSNMLTCTIYNCSEIRCKIFIEREAKLLIFLDHTVVNKKFSGRYKKLNEC